LFGFNLLYSIYLFFIGLALNIVLGECDRKIRLRMEEENKKGDARWEVLVRKVASAKAMSSLALQRGSGLRK